MGNASFNQDWYGMQAKVLAQSDDRVVVDYGCKGRGIVKHYNLFEGIQLCFLDFESDESMETQKYSLQGTTQGRYLAGGVPPVRFSM